MIYLYSNKSFSADRGEVNLLCGPQGLVPALRLILSTGLKPITRFSRGPVLPWELILQVLNNPLSSASPSPILDSIHPELAPRLFLISNHFLIHSIELPYIGIN